MTWELCNGSSQYLVDMWGGCDKRMSWQKAKQHFQEKGYEGRYLLIRRKDHDHFSIWSIEVKPQQKQTPQ